MKNKPPRIFFENASMLSDVYNLEKCNADQCKTMGRPYYLISTQTILNTTLLFTSFCNIKTLAFNGLGRRELEQKPQFTGDLKLYKQDFMKTVHKWQIIYINLFKFHVCIFPLQVLFWNTVFNLSISYSGHVLTLFIS